MLHFKDARMNLITLEYLKANGFKFLFCPYGKKAFVPLRKLPYTVSDRPLEEDELLTIADAMEYAHCEDLLHRMIIVR